MALVEAHRWIAWEHEAYPAYEDFAALPFFALLFLVVRFLLDRFLFEKLATRLIPQGSAGKVARIKKINKFKESAWKFVYFLTSELLVLSVTYNEPWFTNSRNFWIGPGDQVWPEQKTKLKLKLVYMYGAGFYTYSIFALLFWETKRSDFGVSLTHHFASVFLIVFSYIFRFARVGSVVLALHDATDVFMETAKMSKYSNFQKLADVAFLLFFILWTILRIICFPLWVLRSTSYEVLLVFDKERHKFDGPIYYYAFNTLLYFLFILHIYWWTLMLRMLAKQIQSGQVGDDVRSGVINSERLRSLEAKNP